MGFSMATIKEIAELAGVSRGTVDRVLNNRGEVNAETAARVKEIVKALDYRPNKAGLALAVRKKKYKIGLIPHWESLGSPVFLLQNLSQTPANVLNFVVFEFIACHIGNQPGADGYDGFHHRQSVFL